MISTRIAKNRTSIISASRCFAPPSQWLTNECWDFQSHGCVFKFWESPLDGSVNTCKTKITEHHVFFCRFMMVQAFPPPGLHSSVVPACLPPSPPPRTPSMFALGRIQVVIIVVSVPDFLRVSHLFPLYCLNVGEAVCTVMWCVHFSKWWEDEHVKTRLCILYHSCSP